MPYDFCTNDFKTTPFWWDETPRPDLHSALPDTCEVLVVGSGYTGLHCAIQTARAGKHTVVIDAKDAGWGCSARNGGQISGEIKPSFPELSRKHSEPVARSLLGEARHALEWLDGFIDNEAIDCDFRQCGRYVGAHSPRQFRKLVTYAENQPSGMEVPLEVVPRSEQTAEIDSDYYHGGLVIGHHCSLDPAKYHAGLIDLALQAGVTIVSHCEALTHKQNQNGYEIETSRGTVNSSDLVIATNGYSGSLAPWMQRRIVPIGSYMLTTEELPADIATKIMPSDRVFSDTRKVVVYFRLSPDGKRLIFGGRVSVFESDPVKSLPALRTEMLRILPQLANVKISHSWMGFVGFSFDYLPHLGQQDGIYYAMGYCGSGICLASYFGNRLGRQLLGDGAAQTSFNDLPFQTRPLYKGKPWFLGAAVQYYQLIDKIS